MKEKENAISKIKELSKILHKCTEENQKHPCENCLYEEDSSACLVCRRIIKDLLKEIDRL